MNDLIKVDIFDNPIGYISKQKAHEKPVLHRAFSVFLYHDNKMLIQQRAFNKYHSDGLWANTCCSHPRTSNILEDASNRLKEELGITLQSNKLKEVFNFTYLTEFNANLYEYEFDHVFVADYVGKYSINPEEVNDLKWVDIDILAKDLVLNPKKYASWFLICAPKVISYIKGLSNQTVS